MFVEDLNADFNAADLDDRESNGDDIFMLLPLIFGAFGKIPSTIRLIWPVITVFLDEFLMSTSLWISSPVLPTGAYLVEPIRFLIFISLMAYRFLYSEKCMKLKNFLIFVIAWLKNEISRNGFFLVV